MIEEYISQDVFFFLFSNNYLIQNLLKELNKMGYINKDELSNELLEYMGRFRIN